MTDILLRDYKPRPKLVVKETPILDPRFPIVDVHNHLDGTFGDEWQQPSVRKLLDVLDEANVAMLVDLNGALGEDVLNRSLDKFKAAAPERFAVFGGADWAKFPEHGDHFGEWAAARLRDQARRGAQGMKVFKEFGLRYKDQHGARLAVDDPRLDPIWSTAGELGLPVLIHVADPVAFFDPLDNTNERWEELMANPGWQFPSPPFPPFLSIVEELARVVLRHPRTNFIGAHVGCYAENLAWVSGLLDRAPNFHVDISARIAELGRQPYTARRFFMQYPDRILFGLDHPPSVDEYRIHYRFLETDDEYFSYTTAETPGQGRWQIYGLRLPEDVLEKVYRGNARRLLHLDR